MGNMKIIGKLKDHCFLKSIYLRLKFYPFLKSVSDLFYDFFFRFMKYLTILKLNFGITDKFQTKMLPAIEYVNRSSLYFRIFLSGSSSEVTSDICILLQKQIFY